MRHTTATFLNGIGWALKDIAKLLRDRESTLAKYYIRGLPKSEAEPMWTLPLDVSQFGKLPSRRRFWDRCAPLTRVTQNGKVELVQCRINVLCN